MIYFGNESRVRLETDTNQVLFVAKRCDTGRWGLI